MSGKSYFVTQLAKNWENNITLEPLSQIWLVAQSISSGMREKLTETAKDLGIPVFFCLGGMNLKKPKNLFSIHTTSHTLLKCQIYLSLGISNQFFKNSWKRTLLKHGLLSEDVGKQTKTPPTTHKEKEEKEEEEEAEEEYKEEEKQKEEEEEEEEEEKEEEEDEDENNNEECKQFLKSFLSKRKKNTDYFQTIQKPLSSHPRINTSARKFLLLRDGDLNTKNFIHTSKSLPSSKDRNRYSLLIKGGAATRAMTRLQNRESTLPTSSDSETQPQITTRAKKRKREKEETDLDDKYKSSKEKKDMRKEEKEREKEKADKNEESFKAQVEKRKQDLENESSAPILPKSLVLFDDCFSISHTLNENETSKEYKQITQEYLRRLNFIKDFLIHKSHALNVSSILIEQNLLNGAGNSTANNLIKIIRNNCHWIVLFPCLLREYRTFLGAVTSGYNFKVWKHIITTAALSRYDAADQLYDSRQNFPYIFISLSDGNPNFKFRLKKNS